MKSETTIKDIAQTTTGVKPSAIWARVSTQDQRETSIPSQIDRAKNELEQKGYTVNHILQADWTSLDLYSCPEFQKLQTLIKNREIDALGILDRDRLEAKGLQRLIFLSECQEAGVELVICQGPPILDEPEGQLVELALAIGKERQVLRARQGSKDGLRDRAIRRRLPVSYHKLYGYQWDKENNRLVPDENWGALKLIFDMLLGGSTYEPIAKELKNRGIPSPSGQPEWNKTTFYEFLRNPAYTGRYYALRKRAVEPKKRKGTTYGKSSVAKLPLEEAHYIPEIEIINPPITWNQRLQILKQRAQHQKLAQRNAKRDYLLRGMIFCETHKGKNGEPRRYRGTPKKNTWYYTCPVGGCAHSYILGSKIEEEATAQVMALLSLNAERDEVFGKMPIVGATEQSIRKELKSLQTEYQRKIDGLAQLEAKHLFNEILEEVYERTKENLEGRCNWLKVRENELLDQLAQLSRTDDAQTVLCNLWGEFEDRWEELTNNEWRRLFELLNLEIHVWDKEIIEGVYKFASLHSEASGCEVCGQGITEEYVLPTLLPYCEFRFGVNIGLDRKTELPLDTAKKATEIVLNVPESVQ